MSRKRRKLSRLVFLGRPWGRARELLSLHITVTQLPIVVSSMIQAATLLDSSLPTLVALSTRSRLMSPMSVPLIAHKAVRARYCKPLVQA